MGTNYYAVIDCCSHCGRGEEDLHIGKSSMGWAFSLRQHENIRTLDDWIELLSQDNVLIKNEYGSAVPIEELLDTITNRARKDVDRNSLSEAALSMPPTEPDYKHGLLRKHGFDPKTTYDYCDYEFF